MTKHPMKLCVVCKKPIPPEKLSKYKNRKTCSDECLVERRAQVARENNKKHPTFLRFSSKKTIKERRRDFYESFEDLDRKREERIIASIVEREK